MAKYTGPKCRLCRREGQKLFLKGERCHTSKCAMVKRNFPPGMHGTKGYPRLTSYGTQLREKQKVKRIYNIMEKQFRNYFDASTKQQGNTEELLFQKLEMRLDNVVYRLKFTKSRAQARELVKHGHIRVNGKQVDIPSYQVRIGDIITIADSSKDSKAFAKVKEDVKNLEALPWLTLDAKLLEAKVVDKPSEELIKGEFDLKPIIEFYSR